MTIKEARKLLGKESRNRTDDQIKKEIEVVQFFVDTFFDMVKKGKIKL